MQKHFFLLKKQTNQNHLLHDLWASFQQTGSADEVRNPTSGTATAKEAELISQPQEGRKGCLGAVYSVRETKKQGEGAF